MQRLRMEERQFNNLLSESIDETITVLLSQKVTDALYVHLQSTHSISRSEIPYRLETLLATMERIFGLSGSRTIGKAIARKFYAKLGLAFSNNLGGTLPEYVEEAKLKLQEDRV